MSNLLSIIQQNLSSGTISKISGLIGSNPSTTQLGISKMLPSLIKGIVYKGSTESGASSIISLIRKYALGSTSLSNVSPMLAGGSKADAYMDKGQKLSSELFGNSVGDLAAKSGLSGQSSTKLLSAVTPIVMGSVGKVVERDNLDAKGLQRYLVSQSNFASVPPAAAVTEPVKSSGGSFLRWLLPLLILGALLFWFFTKDNGTVAETTENAITTEKQTITTNATHTHDDGTVHEGHSHDNATETNTTAQIKTNADENSIVMSYSVDDDGNLVDANGVILFKAGEFNIKDGEYYDLEGKKVGFMKKVGNVIGDGAKAVGGALGGAATATADAFQNVFGGMFKKKKSGTTVSNYTLNNIQFNTESHKIENFSKNEVVGLANALKAYPDSKIKVQVYTNDGDDDGKNKSLSKTRAEVVRDMLVALGVNKKQISFDGMGAGDVSKAIRDKVEIVVE